MSDMPVEPRLFGCADVVAALKVGTSADALGDRGYQELRAKVHNTQPARLIGHSLTPRKSSKMTKPGRVQMALGVECIGDLRRIF